MPETAEVKRKRKERLTQAEKNDSLIFSECWYQDPAFCAGYFDRSEHAALVNSPLALGMAHTAVHMARKLGDPHLIHRGYGVLVHAHIARVDWFFAGKTLADYRKSALDCCPRCRADVLRREGDLLGEERKTAEAIAALDHSLEEGGRLLDDDERGRTFFLRAIPHHHRGNRDRALADAGEALRLIDLSSPRGIFNDTLACIAIYLRGGDTRHDALALGHLDFFGDRISGRKNWPRARSLHCWIEAHVQARLGNLKLAVKRMDRAFSRILAHGIDREALAVTLDYGQLKTRPTALRNDNLALVHRAIDRCLARRPDIPEIQRKRLKAMKKVLDRHPENAFRVFGEFRQSFVAPVPSGLAERIGPE